MHPTRYLSGLSRRPLRSPRQNRPELLVPPVSPVVPDSVFVQVGLQVFRAHVVVHAAYSSLHQTPESVNRLSMNIARNVDASRVPDATMHTAMRLKTIAGNVLIGENGARREYVFLRQTCEGFRALHLARRERPHSHRYSACRAPPCPGRQPYDCRRMAAFVRLPDGAFRPGISHPSQSSNPPVASPLRRATSGFASTV